MLGVLRPPCTFLLYIQQEEGPRDMAKTKAQKARREAVKQMNAIRFGDSEPFITSTERSKERRRARRAQAITQFDALTTQHKADPKLVPAPVWPFKGPPPISYVTLFKGAKKIKGGDVVFFGHAQKVVIAASVYPNAKDLAEHFRAASRPFLVTA